MSPTNFGFRQEVDFLGKRAATPINSRRNERRGYRLRSAVAVTRNGKVDPSLVPLVVSACIFVVLTATAHWVVGWRRDAILLIFAAVIHLGIVLRFRPVLDGHTVILHFMMVSLSLFTLLLGVGPGFPPDGAFEVLGALLADSWADAGAYIRFGKYAIVIGSVLSLLVVFSSLLIRRKLTSEAIVLGLFVASLLLLPCEFTVHDTHLRTIVFDQEQSQPFIWAVGVGSLEFATLWNLGVALCCWLYFWLGRRGYG